MIPSYAAREHVGLKHKDLEPYILDIAGVFPIHIRSHAP